MPAPECPWCNVPAFHKLELTSAFVDHYKCDAGHILTVDKARSSATPLAQFEPRSSPGGKIEGCPARQGDFNCCHLPLNS
jgi:hypothetical protein